HVLISAGEGEEHVRGIMEVEFGEQFGSLWSYALQVLHGRGELLSRRFLGPDGHAGSLGRREWWVVSGETSAWANDHVTGCVRTGGQAAPHLPFGLVFKQPRSGTCGMRKQGAAGGEPPLLIFTQTFMIAQVR